MAEENFQISAEMEGELNPRIYIIANDVAKFQPVTEHLIKNGFSAQVQVGPPTERPASGSIFFISYNLKSFDAVTLTRNLERKFELFCVVFAEEIGTQTATKLSSAKMTQTLQHPYTEKNFLMAVQTVVRKRRAQFEKDWRKKQHEARQNARRTASDRTETSVDLVVTKDEDSLGSENLILQRAAPRMIDDSAQVFKGEAVVEFVATQDAPVTKSFFAIQEGVDSKHGKRSAPAAVAAKTDAARVEQSSLSISVASESEIPALLRKSRGENSPLPVRQNKTFRQLLSELVSDDRPPSVAWTIVVMCLLGSSICLYCVYQILFT